MAVFSTNQARQFYVVETASATGTHVKSSDAVMHAALQHDSAKSHIYLEYKGVDSLMRSDLIDIKNILYVKHTPADNLRVPLKSYTIKLDTTINGGKPVVGQDYILRIIFRKCFGMSDEDTYFKYGMVHVTSLVNNADLFYKTLAISLAKNFSREAAPLLKFELHSKATKSANGFDANNLREVLPTDTKESFAAVTDIDSIVVTEVEQPWVLGTMSRTSVDYEIQAMPITFEGSEISWVTEDSLVPKKNGYLQNGKTIADMEYFYMGERGDIYRGMGYPNTINTKYLVNPEKAYDVLDIHYAYVGSNESVQKSEKTLTIVCPKDKKAELEKIINTLKTTLSITVETPPKAEGVV